jgi:hypothetical protein
VRRVAPRGPASVADVQTLCQRVRSAGSPNAKARPPLVAEYTRLSESLGLSADPVATGLDLQRAAASLLRAAAQAEAVAAQSPAARLRRAGRPRPSDPGPAAAPGGEPDRREACGTLLRPGPGLES